MLQELANVVVVDDEQVADRAERPAQPRVDANRIAVGVVLHVARDDRSGETFTRSRLPTSVCVKSPAGEPADVALAGELDRDERRRDSRRPSTRTDRESPS